MAERSSKSRPAKYDGPSLLDSILVAADRTGRDGRGRDGIVGYLQWLAREHPRIFAMLLGKVLEPPPAVAEPKEYRTREELDAELEARGIRLNLLNPKTYS